MPRGERSEMGRKRGAGRWRTVVAKPKASGAERAGNMRPYSYHRQSFESATYKTGVDTGPALTNFASIPYWRNCTFT